MVGHLNILTITFAPILIGLAIDFGVHLVTRYEEELRAGADAAGVGIPDEQGGEGVAAASVLKAGATASAEALQQWVKDRLRSSRVPQRIEFRDELPYNETGKLLRRQVRAELAGG